MIVFSVQHIIVLLVLGTIHQVNHQNYVQLACEVTISSKVWANVEVYNNLTSFRLQ